ncbi:hypothetical protein Rcae01_06208 [Novipirellula caenicola]|uniref:Uncharacterized protein n=1 Tax=Novipirellula caenicola TaxID=1536901 RepID=A0ABP9W445_9BACT
MPKSSSCFIPHGHSLYNRLAGRRLCLDQGRRRRHNQSCVPEVSHFAIAVDDPRHFYAALDRAEENHVAASAECSGSRYAKSWSQLTRLGLGCSYLARLPDLRYQLRAASGLSLVIYSTIPYRSSSASDASMPFAISFSHSQVLESGHPRGGKHLRLEYLFRRH